MFSNSLKADERMKWCVRKIHPSHILGIQGRRICSPPSKLGLELGCLLQGWGWQASVPQMTQDKFLMLLGKRPAGPKIGTYKYIFSNPFFKTKLETSRDHIIKFRKKRCYCIFHVFRHVAKTWSVSDELLEYLILSMKYLHMCL